MTATFRSAYAHPALDEARRFTGGDIAATRARLAALARLLDTAFRIPGTNIRMGADAALNLIPGAGTLFAKGLSGYLIWEAHRLGVPKATLVRMLGNLGLDFAISLVPLAGWVGDIFFRANKRNMALLDQHLAGLERR
ncbi:MAG: DUF4112 domain-containing protein [Beijerinckiaceae bacterium]|nr:DUF4112 domain-containing protein [Beijerinckiaceae bacterium]